MRNPRQKNKKKPFESPFESPSKRPLIWTLTGLLLASVILSSAWADSILNSKHNLSVTGPGDTRSLSEDRVCVFCHTPHSARLIAPLWNRRDSVSAYIPYDSPTLKARPGQPTGTSKLCLSCHDGTIAMGDVLSENSPIPFPGGGTMPPGSGLIGTDLRDDHPISFDYASAQGQSEGSLTPSGSWDTRVKLDSSLQMQCTSCHNPHDNAWGDFLVMDNQAAMLCRQCHNLPDFNLTPHAQSPKQWNGQGPDPWPHTDYPDVASNACLNCHRTHHAGAPNELLKSSVEEKVCFDCHNGSVASFDLESVFKKISAHPVDFSQGLHKDGETVAESVGHVECVDCHNPHRARIADAKAPFVKGVLEGVSGLSVAGSPVKESLYEYQICLKCHSENAQQPIDSIPRQIPTSNKRKQFHPASPSYHPIAFTGKNGDVPSLLPPYDESSMIYCSDCHGNDDAQSEVIGSSGPHGSNHEHLLAQQYSTGDDVRETPQSYALCYKCHDRQVILDANRSFPKHAGHLERVTASCSVCHDPHGIEFDQGNAINNAHLINFDTSVVKPLNGILQYESTGPRQGNCTLSCHGMDHSAMTYK